VGLRSGAAPPYSCILHRFFAQRLASMIATLVAVSIVIFLFVRLLPGNIVDIMFGGDAQATPEARAAAARQLGLDGSYPSQYWRWVKGIFQGDMGHSLLNSRPISDMLKTALPITIELIVFGLLIATLIGIPLGVISAVRRDSARDYASRVGGLIGISVPNFWLATLLLVFFSRVFHWVPPLSYVSIFKDPVQNLQEFFMPAISISVFTLAIVMRMVRATMLEVLNLDYVRTARAKGVPARQVVRKHALRNALIPVVTVVGFEVGVLIGGAAVVEIIFGLPGVGYTLLNAIFNRDYPVIQTATLLIAAVFVVVNMVVDLLYGLLDPRISVT
jgi:peptide/nickel transport system permease protein